MKKGYLFLLFFLMVVAGLFFGFKTFAKNGTETKPVGQQLVSKITQNVVITPSPSIAPSIAKPKTFAIPALNVSAAVEEVGMDKEGRMDIPKTWQDVAWYNLGYK